MFSIRIGNTSFIHSEKESIDLAVWVKSGFTREKVIYYPFARVD